MKKLFIFLFSISIISSYAFSEEERERGGIEEITVTAEKRT